jgi:hypothetical protein
MASPARACSSIQTCTDVHPVQLVHLLSQSDLHVSRHSAERSVASRMTNPPGLGDATSCVIVAVLGGPGLVVYVTWKGVTDEGFAAVVGNHLACSPVAVVVTLQEKHLHKLLSSSPGPA